MSEELKPCSVGLNKPPCFCDKCRPRAPITLGQAKQVLAEAGMVAVDGRRNGIIEGLATAAASQIGMTIEQFIVQCELSAQDKPDA